MKIDDIKPVGAFVEYTLRPLLDEVGWLIYELDARGLHITESNVSKVLAKLSSMYIVSLVINFVKDITCLILILITVWKVLQ
jgi:hypothetical protein